jgi:hypothetical protein
MLSRLEGGSVDRKPSECWAYKAPAPIGIPPDDGGYTLVVARPFSPNETSREWLDLLLTGQEPTTEMIADLIRVCGHQEGLYLDFKSGRHHDPAAMLKKYVAGFANSDGGFVVLGYHQTAGVDGFIPPGGGSATEWATRTLEPQMQYLPMPPRIVSATFQDAPAARAQPLLFVATDRSSTLVPCIEKGKPVFYFRIGDSTVAAPEYATIGVPDYLVADLMLGRRHRPHIVATSATLRTDTTISARFGTRILLLDTKVRVSLENRSLVFAERVSVGLVSWSLVRLPSDSPTRPSRARSDLLGAFHIPRPPNLDERTPSSVPTFLRAHIEAVSPEHPHFSSKQKWELLHCPGWGGLVDLPPFMDNSFTFGKVGLPVVEDEGPGDGEPVGKRETVEGLPQKARITMTCALYVVPKGSEPEWFEIRIAYDSSVTVLGWEGFEQGPNTIVVAIRRCMSDRPRISLAIEGAEASSTPSVPPNPFQSTPEN